MLTIPFIVIVTCVCVKQSYKEEKECNLSFFSLFLCLTQTHVIRRKTNATRSYRPNFYTQVSCHEVP